MKLSTALGLLLDIRFALKVALWPTLSSILHSPSLLLHRREISRIFMSHVWNVYGDGLDEWGRPIKTGLVANTRGVVLDLGAGHGHTAKYLDFNHVTEYIALEPNLLMHSKIRKTAAAAGFTEAAGSLLVLPHGAEDINSIVSSLGGPHTIDVLISVQTMCCVPDPERSLHALVDQVLKPGGQFLFYEHVLSPREDVAWWQRFWTPLCRLTMDGCSLDRPFHQWVQKMDVWEDGSVWMNEDESEEHLFCHRAGKFIKSVARS